MVTGTDQGALFADGGEVLGQLPGQPRAEDLPSCEVCAGTGLDRTANAARHAGTPSPIPGRHLVLAVFVPGKPTSAGSIKAISHRTTGRAVAIKTNTSDQTKWRADVQNAVRRVWGDRPPLDCAVSVHIDFVMPRPLSLPKRRTPPMISRPDGDKLDRAAWDALTHIVYVDDARVVSWSGSKRWAEREETPGAHIWVYAEEQRP